MIMIIICNNIFPLPLSAVLQRVLRANQTWTR